MLPSIILKSVVGALALLTYEFIVTFDDEYNLIWTYVICHGLALYPALTYFATFQETATFIN